MQLASRRDSAVTLLRGKPGVTINPVLKSILFGVLPATFVMYSQTLPPPFETPAVNNPPVVIARPAGAKLIAPAGFHMEEYASGFQRPRFMVEGPGGEVLVSDTTPNGFVYAIKGGEKKVLLGGLDRPYGLAFWKNYLYVGEPSSIKRASFGLSNFTPSSSIETGRVNDRSGGASGWNTIRPASIGAG